MQPPEYNRRLEGLVFRQGSASDLYDIAVAFSASANPRSSAQADVSFTVTLQSPIMAPAVRKTLSFSPILARGGGFDICAQNCFVTHCGWDRDRFCAFDWSRRSRGLGSRPADIDQSSDIFGGQCSCIGLFDPLPLATDVAIRNGDRVVVSLVPAAGALPELLTSDDTLSFVISGKPPVATHCDMDLGNKGIPQGVIDDALENPSTISGWGERCNPSVPLGPFNSFKTSLSLQRLGVPYDRTFNPVVYRCGCGCS